MAGSGSVAGSGSAEPIAVRFGGDFASRNSSPVTALQPESPTQGAALQFGRRLGHKRDLGAGVAVPGGDQG